MAATMCCRGRKRTVALFAGRTGREHMLYMKCMPSNIISWSDFALAVMQMKCNTALPRIIDSFRPSAGDQTISERIENY
eukprot:scaffold134406_cov19-Prasinocladus_malaysianus.AAC.1